MKKLLLSISSILLALSIAIPGVYAESDVNVDNENVVELTKGQKKELEKLHKEILEKRIEMIDKHEEFGIISTEKAKKIKEKLQEKFDYMKENGYMPSKESMMRHKDCKEKEE